MKCLSHEQARLLLDTARGDRFEALYVLAVTTGLRQGELLGLKWEDMDLEAKSLSVRRTLSAAKEGPIFTTPKSPKSRRKVTLTEGAVEVLKRHRQRQLEESKMVGAKWQDNGLVFCSVVGTPMSRYRLHNPRHLFPRAARHGRRGRGGYGGSLLLAGWHQVGIKELRTRPGLFLTSYNLPAN